MGPVRQKTDNFPSYPPDNHHCSDDVYLREGEINFTVLWQVYCSVCIKLREGIALGLLWYTEGCNWKIILCAGLVHSNAYNCWNISHHKLSPYFVKVTFVVTLPEESSTTRITSQLRCGRKFFLSGLCANHSWSHHWKKD